MDRLRIWIEVYEHEEFGEIQLTWLGEAPDRSSLIALQFDLWTLVDEVEDCLKWARSLQRCETGESGDAVMAEERPLPN